MKDGTIHQAETHINKGDVEDPYPAEELRAKYFELAAPVWGVDVADAVYQDLVHLEEIQDIGRITERLVRE
jgi:hypothetical protein